MTGAVPAVVLAFVPSVAAIMGLGSGVAMAALGWGVYRASRHRASSLAFALFAALWGLTVVLGNLARMASDAATLAPLVYAFVAFSSVLYLPAFLFVSLHPTPVHPAAKRAWFLALAATPALVLVALLALRPALFIAGVIQDGSQGTLTRGPLYRVVINGAGALVPAVALAVCSWRYAAARPGILATQLRFVMLAFLPFVAYQGTRALAFASISANTLSLGVDPASTILFLALGFLSVSIVIYALVNVRWRFALGLSVLAILFAIAESTLSSLGLIVFDTVGVWRMATVLILAYAIARYQLFNLDERLQGVLPMGGFLVLSLLGLEILWNMFGPSFRDAPLLGIAATLGFEMVAVSVPLVLARTWHNLTLSGNERERVHRRHLEVYEAALLAANASGGIDRAEARVLAELRKAFGLTVEDHERLLGELEAGAVR